MRESVKLYFYSHLEKKFKFPASYTDQELKISEMTKFIFILTAFIIGIQIQTIFSKR